MTKCDLCGHSRKAEEDGDAYEIGHLKICESCHDDHLALIDAFTQIVRLPRSLKMQHEVSEDIQ